jgi:hypothetical protein
VSLRRPQRLTRFSWLDVMITDFSTISHSSNKFGD